MCGVQIIQSVISGVIHFLTRGTALISEVYIDSNTYVSPSGDADRGARSGRRIAGISLDHPATVCIFISLSQGYLPLRSILLTHIKTPVVSDSRACDASAIPNWVLFLTLRQPADMTATLALIPDREITRRFANLNEFTVLTTEYYSTDGL